MRKSKMRTNKKELNLRSMGVSNQLRDEYNKKTYSIQFYDFDYNGLNSDEIRERIEDICNMFPYDLILYQTKHGVQFISFALLHGTRYTKSKAVGMSKSLGNQDYWTEAKDLTLRISPKWNKKRKEVSFKPKFLHLVKKPLFHRISNKHLEFYKNFMELPENVYREYDFCDKKDYKMKLYHYKTRD